MMLAEAEAEDIEQTPQVAGPGSAQQGGEKPEQADTPQADAKEDRKGKKEAPTVQRRRMQFLQYMRRENEEDRELLNKLSEHIGDYAPQGWEREDHLDDLRPAIWFRMENHVTEVYANLGCIAAVFGFLPKIEGEKQDFTMMKLIFPPVELPHMREDEDTGEKEEDFDEVRKKLDEYLVECAAYIQETSKEKNKKTGDSENKRRPKQKAVTERSNAG
jgi:hypothetical protein